MISMTENHLIEEGRLKYTEFVTQMCKIMVCVKLFIFLSSMFDTYNYLVL